MILSLVNVKGGVGKTTTAVNLSATFAASDLRVLLVDLDPQGSASFSLGAARDDHEPTAADVLLDGLPAAAAIQQTGIEGLDILPGSMALAASELGFARKRSPELFLKKALQQVRRRYDAILIDCPPGLSILTLNGLAASTAYILPVLPQDLVHEALDRFFEGWDRLQATLRTKPELLGILINMVDKRTNLTGEMVGEIRKAYGRRVFKTEIPINIRLAEAPGYGMSIFEYERWSTGAQAYRLLGAEAIRRARKAGLL